jgi:hypothetical protein
MREKAKRQERGVTATDPHTMDLIARTHIMEKVELRMRITKLEGDLSVARLQLQRIDEELVASYGEIATMPVTELRRILGNIAYIVNPTRQ